MRIYKDNQGFILTNKKAAEIFCILGSARIKLQGKLRTDCEKYWKEFEKDLGLSMEIEEEYPFEEEKSKIVPINPPQTNILVGVSNK